MTIKDLYDICDQMNINTKVFIINSDRVAIAWNNLYMNLPRSISNLKIEHYRFVSEDEVFIWVA